ncbi:tyrosine-protein phosphatase [Halioglobus pacificus]|uniref:Tyrosine-protein phosphatase n=1 Tax=Parahalioglobus pacificus TaxID=930806 RepID=A0A919CI49_9GAMM|nr:tyrosine-protein phosphatase [Halioglobus pacificus]GHD26297.1 hypothetical protein GCM10007053_03050 [Halioglobus pacificus]
MASRASLKYVLLGLFLLVIAVIQFIPSAPVVVPAALPETQREAHRVLNFGGVANFRDLGGYPTEDGLRTRWGVLYRSGALHETTAADRQALSQLGLNRLIDFRSEAEKTEEPDKLPESSGFATVAIPTMDGGDHSVADEIIARIENGNFDDFDPDGFMLEANRQFASRFTPQYRQFIGELLDANGQPVLWHCSAGKDRAGFASALILRIVGVPESVVMQDYLKSKAYALEARKRDIFLLRLFKGDMVADKLTRIMGVEPEWLEAAFRQIDADYGDFDTYVREGLGLTEDDISRLRAALLEPVPA